MEYSNEMKQWSDKVVAEAKRITDNESIDEGCRDLRIVRLRDPENTEQSDSYQIVRTVWDDGGEILTIFKCIDGVRVGKFCCAEMDDVLQYKNMLAAEVNEYYADARPASVIALRGLVEVLQRARVTEATEQRMPFANQRKKP